MTTLRNSGPRVDIPALGIVVDEGDTFDAPDHMVEGLIAQGFTKPKASPAVKATPKASAPTQEGDD